MWQYGVTVEGYDAAPGENTDVAVNYVSPDFFRTVEMPLISGSGFERAQARDRQNVAIVNERFVERFGLDAGTALGKRITTGTDGPVDARDRRHRAGRKVQPDQSGHAAADVPAARRTPFSARSCSMCAAMARPSSCAAPWSKSWRVTTRTCR